MALSDKTCRDCGKVMHQTSLDGELAWFTVCPHCGATDPYRTTRQTLVPLGIFLAIIAFIWLTRG
jgi:hypothetical protein